MRGNYIVIEGGDGTGKTTQCLLLKELLETRGESVLMVSEPADPVDADEPLKIARELRKLIKNGNIERTPETNLLLFTAARVEKWRREIEPALAAGSHVISSRNYWSTLAYQGYGEGLSLELILSQTEMYLGTTGYLHPDISIILAMQDEQARQARVQNRGLHEVKDTFETKDQTFQDKVAQGYLSIARQRDIQVISADGTPEEVSARLIAGLAGNDRIKLNVA